MSSSEDETVQDKTSLDRVLFVKLLLMNPTICEKSQIPSFVAAKKVAWNAVTDEY